MIDYALEVENVSLTFSYTNSRTVKSFLLNIYKKDGKKRVEYFQALKDISFKIERGKNVGFLGKNGSGKSTLLRVIANVYSPDSGHVKVNSDSISLLALGLGFNTALNGIENIYMTGYLMGYSKEKIDGLIPAIIEFAELDQFMYRAIKTYSSGMRSRLAFSIAVHFDSEILLIDEVLGVGDESFQQKCNVKMKELVNDENRTILLVSHNMGSIKEICDEVIWLKDGRIEKSGDPILVTNEYITYMKEQKNMKEKS